MKAKHILLFFGLLLIFGCGSTSTIFELESQSMGMVGQGPGRDGAINPFEGQPSVAVVKNLGDHPIGIRIERPDQPLELTDVPPKTKQSFVLQPKDKLFFDSQKTTRTKLTFKKYRP